MGNGFVTRASEILRKAFPRTTSEQPKDRLPMLDQPPRAVQVVAVLDGRVDADGVVDGGDEIVGMYGIKARIGAVAVGCAVGLAGTDAAAGDQASVAFGPVVAAAGADVVRRRGADLRRAAELADGEHERRIQ